MSIEKTFIGDRGWMHLVAFLASVFCIEYSQNFQLVMQSQQYPLLFLRHILEVPFPGRLTIYVILYGGLCGGKFELLQGLLVRGNSAQLWDMCYSMIGALCGAVLPHILPKNVAHTLFWVALGCTIAAVLIILYGLLKVFGILTGVRTPWGTIYWKKRNP